MACLRGAVSYSFAGTLKRHIRLSFAVLHRIVWTLERETLPGLHAVEPPQEYAIAETAGKSTARDAVTCRQGEEFLWTIAGAGFVVRSEGTGTR